MRKPLIAAIASLSLAAPITYAQQLVWSDEFDNNTLDTSTWTFTTGGSGNGNGELQFYTASQKNIFQQDGNLVIQALREEKDGKQFTSSRIHTNGRFSFTYGTLVARIQLPDLAEGLWPAFWTLGDNIGVDGWPKSGEFDILEAGFATARAEGRTNRSVSSAAHWWHESGDWSDWLQADASNEVQIPTPLQDFHLYKMDWTPSTLTFSVDDTVVFNMDIDDPNVSEFHLPQHILLNLAVGGFNFVDITDPAQITAPFPAQMRVDYVRLYDNGYTVIDQKEACNGVFGVMTELTTTDCDYDWGDRANIYLWNNMAAVATQPSEGSSALAYEIQPGDWWGMGLLHRDYNLAHFSHGYLHFDMKTASNTDISINMESSAAAGGSVVLTAGGDEYGLVRDGEWHHVAIPLSKFGGVDWSTVKTLFSMSGPAPQSLMTLAVDNIYLTPDVTLDMPEYGNYGLYTETPDHQSAGNFGFGVTGDLFIWEETLEIQPGNVAEGNGSLHVSSTGKGWFGLGLTAREAVNLTAFDNGNAALHFKMKTTDTTPFSIGIKSGNVDVIGQTWIDFKPGADPYGFARDGQWHELVIPMGNLVADLNLYDVRQVFQLLGIGEISSLAIDDIYLSGGQAGSAIPGVPEVNREPLAAIKPSVLGGEKGVTIDFDGSKSLDLNGDPLTYAWNFGDGETASGAQVSHTFDEEGSYKVSLTVSDGSLSATTAAYILVDNDFGQQRSEKRGLGYGNHSQEDMAAISQGVTWWYNWSTQPDVMVADVYQDYGIEFVPMTWNGNFDDQALRNYIDAHPEVKYLLAFNEPNFIDQANMTPSEAAAQWPRLEAIADAYDLKIVSVAMNYCGNCNEENGVTFYDPIDYLDRFFEVCPDCRVDAISIHAYMPDAGAVEWYIDRFNKYGRPIWLTEFSAWEDSTTLADQKHFLTQIVDSMETMDNLERYAWFVGRRQGHPYNGLFDWRQSGVLSELGNVYVQMPVHNDSVVHTLPGLIEAETYNSAAGVRVELTEDATGFLNISAVESGDNLQYRINGDAGSYHIEARVASVTGGRLLLQVGGTTVGELDIPATGGLQNWQTVDTTVSLPGGSQMLNLVATAVININWLNTVADDLVEPTPTPTPTPTPPPGDALPCSAYASSVEAGYSADAVCDGNGQTRWGSAFGDAEWIVVDLGTETAINKIDLVWEAAFGKAYELQVSNDGNNWQTVASEIQGNGGTDTFTVSASGRYVRMLGSERGTPWGYSLWSFDVYGETGVVQGDLAEGKSVAASSEQDGYWLATYAVDGDAGTRWSSAWTDSEWITVDLGSSYTISRVALEWEAAFASGYDIRVSTDGTQWNTVSEIRNADGGRDEIEFSATQARYVQMRGVTRATPYGYSLFSFEVYY